VIVLAGGRNSSTGYNQFDEESLKELDKIMNSKVNDKLHNEPKTEFEIFMNSCKPNIETDDEKLKVWTSAFNFPKKLNNFIEKLKKQLVDKTEIKPVVYIELVDAFIKDLKIDKDNNPTIDEDEFLIKKTQNIAGEKYKIDLDVIKNRSNLEVGALVKKISENNKKKNPMIPEDYKTRFTEHVDFFKKTMKDVKKNQLEVKADKKIIEKKYDKVSLNFDMDEELIKTGMNVTKKLFPKYMDIIAASSIIAILGLAIMSVVCFGCGSLDPDSTAVYPIFSERVF